MPRTPISHRATSLIASFALTFAMLELIAGHTRADAGAMMMVQAPPAVVAQATPH